MGKIVHVQEKKMNKTESIYHRKITTTVSSMGILKKQLVKNIGSERIGSFLFQFGSEIGIYDAKQGINEGFSIEELVKLGPRLHMDRGHILGIDHKADIEYDAAGEVKSVLGRGYWYGSYEAEEHINILGISDKPVCYTLAGYASGFMSTVFGKELIAQEYTCIGKGDKECRWVIKPKEDWENEIHHDIHFYNQTPIIQELEYTYDNLLEQTKMVMKLSEYQKQLTEEIINGNGLQKLVDMTYEMIKIPIIVEDTHIQTLSFAGLDKNETAIFNNESKEKLQMYRNEGMTYSSPFKKKSIKIKNHFRRIVPIIAQKKVLGYCSFVTKEQPKEDEEYIFLLLNHLSNAIALVLINEKSAYESYERMKGAFLNQILDEKIPSVEIINKGKYIGLDFNQDIHVALIEYTSGKDNLQEEFAFHESILESAFHYFKENKVQVLVGERNNLLTILFTDTNNVNVIIKDFKKKIEESHRNVQLRIGLSSRGNSIEAIAKCNHEAEVALRLAITKEIVSYTSLGIVGALINSNNINAIEMIAREHLKELYITNEPRYKELFNTLYFFLVNGGNLNKTKTALSLSMSGLRHRVERIEEILGKDLRDAEEANHLLLILKALIVIKELDVLN